MTEAPLAPWAGVTQYTAIPQGTDWDSCLWRVVDSQGRETCMCQQRALAEMIVRSLNYTLTLHHLHGGT